MRLPDHVCTHRTFVWCCRVSAAGKYERGHDGSVIRAPQKPRTMPSFHFQWIDRMGQLSYFSQEGWVI